MMSGHDAPRADAGEGAAPASSAPSSSALQTARAGPPLDLVPPPLLHLFSLHPFNAIPSSAIPLLTDILHHYLSLVTKRAARNAEHAQRNSIVPWDVVDTLHSIGASDPSELKGWLASEERNEWASRCENGWSDERAKQEYEARRTAWRAKMDYGRCNTHSEAGPSSGRPQRRMRMDYVHVPDEDLPLYEELRLIQEGRRLRSERRASNKRRKTSRSADASSERSRSPSASPADVDGDDTAASDSAASDDDLESAAASLPSPSTARTSPSPPEKILPPDTDLYRVRDRPQRPNEIIDYVPWFLPPFPGSKIGGVAEVVAGGDGTASKAATTTNISPAPVVKTEEEVALEGEEAATAAAAYTPSYFAPPIAFSASPAFNAVVAGAGDGDGDESNGGEGATAPASSAAIDDLASISSTMDKADASTKPPRTSSSLPAFIADYTALVSSESSNANVYMPSTATRRQMAVSLTSPATYDPRDTLYGGIPARPSASPFIPSASHLITLPPSREGGAPRFTPIRPSGRPLKMTPSGVSNPILAHRHPSTIENLARYFSSQAPKPHQPERNPDGSIIETPRGAAGEATHGVEAAPPPTPSNVLISSSPLSASTSFTPNLSLLHRCLHLMDPEPLRDAETYVERVFRGVTVSGGSENSLTRPESFYKSAVDAIKAVSTANSKPAAVSAASDAGGKSSSSKKSSKSKSKSSSKKSKGNRKSQYYDGLDSDEFEDDEESEEDESDGGGGGAAVAAVHSQEPQDIVAHQVRKRAGMKIKSGTLVFTWDWESRDYTAAASAAGAAGAE